MRLNIPGLLLAGLVLSLVVLGLVAASPVMLQIAEGLLILSAAAIATLVFWASVALGLSSVGKIRRVPGRAAL